MKSRSRTQDTSGSDEVNREPDLLDEWCARFDERVGILGQGGEPTEGERAIAQREANAWLASAIAEENKP